MYSRIQFHAKPYGAFRENITYIRQSRARISIVSGRSLTSAVIGYYKRAGSVYLRGKMASMDFHTASISCAASIAVTTDS